MLAAILVSLAAILDFKDKPLKQQNVNLCVMFVLSKDCLPKLSKIVPTYL
jgi:hypothetical protein